MLSGVVAKIRWAYYDAADINGYTLTWDKTERRYVSASGVIILADAFKLSQRPLRLIVPIIRNGNKQSWEFPILEPCDVPRHAGPFTVKLGKPV